MSAGADRMAATAPDVAIAPLQRHFLDLLLRLGNGRDPMLVELVQRLCVATAAGHACIELDDVMPSWRTAERALLDSGVVGRPGDFTPLVVDATGRLYTWRYWRYEQTLAANLLERARTLRDDVDPRRLSAPLQQLFPGETGDLQRVAAAVAVMRQLCVLSGGPGTGKTTTIVRLLATLVQWHAPARLRIALAAPTGKAAARMQEAVRAARGTLPLDPGVIDAIPMASTTLHRLLGARPGASRFTHDRDRPLPVDVLVVDEASMVDLALMSRLVDALPRHARLILVGDRDQLASVEPGAVLGSLCAGSNAYTPRFAAALRIAAGCDVPEADVDERPFGDSCVLLSHSHRFAGGGAIARLARAIRDGDAEVSLAQLRAGGDVQWHAGPEPRQDLRVALAGPLGRYVEAIARGDAAAAFAAFEGFRVLCAVRDGPFGARWLNEAIELHLRRSLRDAGLAGGTGEWFAGRAVMINRNHRATRLFNGDVALIVPGQDGLRAWLRAPGHDLRELSPARLPAHEPAYALTIHKSQGSEFDEVLVVLPNADSPVLTRELLYTALTRARRKLVLWGSEAAVRAAIARPTRRGSGLRDACWGPVP